MVTNGSFWAMKTLNKLVNIKIYEKNLPLNQENIGTHFWYILFNIFIIIN